MDPTWVIQLQTSSCISERSHHLLGQFSLHCRYAGHYGNLSRNETPFGRTVSLQRSTRDLPVVFRMGVPALVVLFQRGYRKVDKTATPELGWQGACCLTMRSGDLSWEPKLQYLGTVAHAFNPSPGHAETGGCPGLAD